MIWREKGTLLIVLALLLAANTIFFFTYRVQYQQRLAALEERRESSESRLIDARAARLAAERRVAAYRGIQADIQDVYDNYWGTQSERLEGMIAEVKRLATASQMIPRAYSFTRAQERKVGQGTTVMGIAFSVQGTYQQVRRLINLLELSQHFVIIDSVALTSGNDQILTLNLHLKTLFRDGSPRTATGREL